jgi:hypothetical protein
MKKHTINLAFGLFLFGPFLATLSADDKTLVDNDDIRKTSEMLLSDDHIIRERGVEMIRNHHSQQIAALKQLILDKQNFVHRPKSVEASILLLGEMHAIESVDLLVALVDYPFCAHPDAQTIEEITVNMRPRIGGISSSSLFTPFERRCPAVSALIRIGEPCRASAY